MVGEVFFFVKLWLCPSLQCAETGSILTIYDSKSKRLLLELGAETAFVLIFFFLVGQRR